MAVVSKILLKFKRTQKTSFVIFRAQSFCSLDDARYFSAEDVRGLSCKFACITP